MQPEPLAPQTTRNGKPIPPGYRVPKHGRGLLGPPLTSEIGKRMAPIGNAALKRKRQMERELKALLDDPTNARTLVVAQLQKILAKMAKLEADHPRFAKLASILDKLWPKAFDAKPTANARKPRQAGSRLFDLPTPAAVEASPESVENAPTCPVLGDTWQLSDS